MAKKKGAQKNKRKKQQLQKAGPRKPLNTSIHALGSLTVAMMVKNEEYFIEDAIKSALKVADEVVIVDTGSTDRTIEIIQRYPVKLRHFEWNDDFSAARNETIKHSTSDWILVLDADERVVIQNSNLKSLKVGLKQAEQSGIHIILININNRFLDGRLIDNFSNGRIFINNGLLKYRNRVHERLDIADPESNAVVKHTSMNGLHIDHFGYDPNIYKGRNKSDRSLPLIEKMLEDDPNDMEFQCFLGREFVIKKDYERARVELEKAVFGRFDGHKNFFVESLKLLLFTYKALEVSTEHILTFAELGIQEEPTQPDFWLYKGQALALDPNQSQEAIRFLKKGQALLKTYVAKDTSYTHPFFMTRQHLIHDLIGELHEQRGEFSDAYHEFIKLTDMPTHVTINREGLYNKLIQLAIKLEDHELVKSHIKGLLNLPQNTFAGLYYYGQHLLNQREYTKTQELLEWAMSISTRCKTHPQTQKLLERLVTEQTAN